MDLQHHKHAIVAGSALLLVVVIVMGPLLTPGIAFPRLTPEPQPRVSLNDPQRDVRSADTVIAPVVPGFTGPAGSNPFTGRRSTAANASELPPPPPPPLHMPEPPIMPLQEN
jgi:hypothetical protein